MYFSLEGTARQIGHTNAASQASKDNSNESAGYRAVSSPSFFGRSRYNHGEYV